MRENEESLPDFIEEPIVSEPKRPVFQSFAKVNDTPPLAPHNGGIPTTPYRARSAFEISESDETARTLDYGMSEEDREDAGEEVDSGREIHDALIALGSKRDEEYSIGSEKDSKIPNNTGDQFDEIPLNHESSLIKDDLSGLYFPAKSEDKPTTRSEGYEKPLPETIDDPNTDPSEDYYESILNPKVDTVSKVEDSVFAYTLDTKEPEPVKSEIIEDTPLPSLSDNPPTYESPNAYEAQSSDNDALEASLRELTSDSTVNDENAADKDIEEISNNDENSVIYKKERPLLKIALWVLGSVAVIFIILCIVGFVMGWNGVSPPSLDSEVLQNQWDNVTGNSNDTPVNELE